ncbi:hypothetical protein BT69DRAFT_1296533 [Atractiella rhizophila]|nr:hypothetical protein BT69DRAFT_1296533 [Atractiella rhizophila]
MEEALKECGAGEEWQREKREIEDARINPLSSTRILTHAQRLAPFTSSLTSLPSSLQTLQSTVLPPHIRPPFPSETSMRQGRLAASILRGSVGEISETKPPVVDEEGRRRLEEVRLEMGRRERGKREREREKKKEGIVAGFELDLNPEL